MLPMPNTPYPLRQVITAMGGNAPAVSDEVPVIPEEKYNPHVTGNWPRLMRLRVALSMALSKHGQ